ncbi:MAG: nitroreductase family deazaflavin-dependent oxidoreductase [Chloroflexi bacterium]|nr:nitroreductase family deazaflavin-dependent oxidoreductase [Chloroflexota bacterium]
MATHEASPEARPGWLTRQFFKVPVQMYRLGLGRRLEGKFLTLTTTGRRTGRARTVALDYVEEEGLIYVFAGYGTQSNWYRNVLAHPRVTIRVGARRLHGVARPIEDAAERCRLVGALHKAALRGAHGPPRPVRWLMKRLGILDYEASLNQAVATAERVPAVEIAPTGDINTKEQR